MQKLQQALVSSKNIIKVRNNTNQIIDDLLVTEEPLEMRVTQMLLGNLEQHTIGITMRTPGNDFELTTGFLFTERVISNYNEISSIAFCESDKSEFENIVKVTLKENVSFDIESLKRNFYAGSSCGVCGKASIDSVIQKGIKPIEGNIKISAEIIKTLPSKINEKQTVFKHTGGIHASVLFNANGDLLCLREDVGRHNALDKLIGFRLMNIENSFDETVLLLSGRISFELVQKAAVAGIPVIAAIGAPSGLAVDLAQQSGITLIGFLKETGFNIYTNAQRIVF